MVRAGGCAGNVNCKGIIIGMFEELEYHKKKAFPFKREIEFLFTPTAFLRP